MSSKIIFRKQFLVNRPYQVRFIGEIVLVVIMATALSLAGTYVLMTGELASGFESVENKLARIQVTFPRILFVSGVVTFIAMAFVGAFITLRETHRVIGPVGKMEKKFREMTEGNFSYMIPFRKGDVLKGLDESINIHLNNLSDFFTNYDKVMRDIVPLVTAVERGDGDSGENLAAIRDYLEKLEHQADAFRSG